MGQDDLPQRITSRPDVFGGNPIIRDLRISVEAIPEDHPGLERVDINACLADAHAVIAHDPGKSISTTDSAD